MRTPISWVRCCTAVATTPPNPIAASSAADVAKTGYHALMKGDRSVIYGFKNKLQVAAASVLGGGFSSEAHRKQAEPGSGD